MQKDPVTVIIDGNSICYRAFYKVSGMSSDGIPTSVLSVFLQILEKLRSNKNIADIILVFDSKGKNFRHDLYDNYKANRSRMPEDLIIQMEILRHILPHYGYPIYSVEGYEADDIIYTLASTTESPIWIITKDKDLHQLIDSRVKIYDYKDEKIIGEKEVEEKFNLRPSQIADFLAIAGDSSDNIPGVKGVGAKGAVSILQSYNSLENIISLYGKESNKILDKIFADIDNLKLSMKLVQLSYIEDIASKVQLAPYSPAKLYLYFKKYKLNSLIKKLLQTYNPKEDPILQNNLPLEDIDIDSIKTNVEVDIKAQIFSINNNYKLTYGKVCKPIFLANLFGRVYLCDNNSYEEVTDFLSLNDMLKGSDIFYYDIKELFKLGIEVSPSGLDLLLLTYIIDPDSGGFQLNIKTDDISTFLANLLKKKDDILKVVDDFNLKDLYFNIELPIAFILAKMERKGILIDPDNIYNVAKELEGAIAKLNENIKVEAGCPLNLNSPKQLGDYLYTTIKLKGFKKNKSGSYSTDEESLLFLAEKYPQHKKLIESILNYREYNKLLSTYTTNLLDYTSKEDGAIHTCFKQFGTATGRLSSINPNMQNLPAKGNWSERLRASFVARSGYSLVSIDYSQIELRILAHMSEDSTLISLFNEDKDIHEMTARRIFKIADNKEVSDNNRRIAKAVNFGIIYGLSGFGLSKEIGTIGKKEAETFIESYFELYPNVKTLLEDITKKTKEDGFYPTVLGRKRFVPDINSRNKNVEQRAIRMANNAPIQGSAADIIKLAMIKMDKYIAENNLDASILLQIHDELIFEVADNILNKFEEDAKAIMQEAIKLKVPLSVHVASSKTLGGLK